MNGGKSNKQSKMKKYKWQVDGLSDDEFSDITVMKEEDSAYKDQLSEQSIPLSRINYHKQKKTKENNKKDDVSITENKRKHNVEKILEEHSRGSSHDSEEERFIEWQKRREMMCRLSIKSKIYSH